MSDRPGWNGDEDRLAVLVRAEQVRALFTKGLLPYLTNVINATLIVVVLWSAIDHVAAVAWVAVFAAVAGARIAFQRAYHRRAPAAEDARAWGNAFAIGSALFGSLWGVAAVAFFVDGEPIDQVLLVFVVGGMCAGATTSAASYPRAFRAFVAFACLPLIARLAIENDRVHWAMAAMIALFAVAMATIARAGAAALVEAVTLRFRNAAMADSLRAAQADLEKANEKLARQVEESHGEVVQAGLMASVGRLAAGVGHEINNPLTFVLSNLTLLEDALAADDPLHKVATDARTGAERIREVVKDLRTFARIDGGKRGSLAIDPIVESCLSLASAELKHRATVIKELGNPPAVVAERGRLAQVLLNLIVRAAANIPVGAASQHHVRIATTTDADGWAVFAISDTGPAIPPEQRAHIFEPFYRARVGDAGFALSICHRIVSDLGGAIDVDADGTGFRLRLPPAPPVTPAATAQPASSERRGKILVVDDDPLVARVVQRALGAIHEVEVASDARVGLARMLAGEFDVVLCDLMMPDMTGMDLHAEVTRSSPDKAKRMVFMTGGAFTDHAQRFLDEVPNRQLWKPFNAVELRELIKTLIV
jgi:signal transduction histidine kinase